MGKTVEGFELPLPEMLDTEAARQRALYDPTVCQQQYEDNYSKVNDEQMKFIQIVKNLLAQQNGGLLFLNGAAGKTPYNARRIYPIYSQILTQVVERHLCSTPLFRTSEVRVR